MERGSLRAAQFFPQAKKIIDAKLQSKNITADWYKDAFLNPKLTIDEIAINSGYIDGKGVIISPEEAQTKKPNEITLICTG